MQSRGAARVWKGDIIHILRREVGVLDIEGLGEGHTPCRVIIEMKHFSADLW